MIRLAFYRWLVRLITHYLRKHRLVKIPQSITLTVCK